MSAATEIGHFVLEQSSIFVLSSISFALFVCLLPCASVLHCGAPFLVFLVCFSPIVQIVLVLLEIFLNRLKM